MPPIIENQSSILLSTDENLQVFNLLGNRCQTMATTVVQLFLTAPPSHSQWYKKDTGVLCFVKDNGKKNYFFRLFNLSRNQMVWEHEMYNNMEYVESAPFFHTFEGEDCIVAFNFANQSEAKSFKAVVDQKIELKKRKIEEKRSRPASHAEPFTLPQKNRDIYARQEYRKEKRKRNITKADIGTPTGFVHVYHVGWNPETGFDGDELQQMFNEAGVSEKDLRKKSTRKFIYDFINKHQDKNTPSIKADPNPPAVPPRYLSRPSSGTPRPAPPPPPSNRPQMQENSAPKKTRPPSPPKHFSTTTTSGNGGGPPPPPPPPAPSSNAPPPPPMMMGIDNGELPMPPQPSLVPDGNAALLQSIRDGTTLKPVEDRTPPSPVEDARGDLLSEIRKGIQLKPVDEREMKQSQNPSPTSTGGHDLASALKQALLERSKFIQSDDDDEDDTSSTSNDEEWD